MKQNLPFFNHTSSIPGEMQIPYLNNLVEIKTKNGKGVNIRMDTIELMK